jgi:hypothetical protein
MESLYNASADRRSASICSLPREALGEIILILRAALPRPLTETAEDGLLRDRAAMAAVALLLPETAVEGRLAAQFVAADAWAMDCLRLAQERAREPRIAERCRAQAMGMMREGKSALKALERLQAQRRILAKDEAAAGQAAWIEHCAIGMMAAALEAVVTPPGVTPPGAAGKGRKFRQASKRKIRSSKSCAETAVGSRLSDTAALGAAMSGGDVAAGATPRKTPGGAFR